MMQWWSEKLDSLKAYRDCAPRARKLTPTRPEETRSAADLREGTLNIVSDIYELSESI